MAGKPQRNNRRGGKRRRSKPRRYGGVARSVLIERHAEFDKDAGEKADSRFNLDPLPIAIPKDFEKPKEFSFKWKNRPVALETEANLASKVVRKGEFGWLSDSRVNEIGEMVDELDMTLDQALSLRSALLQQKTVYSHGILQSRGRQLLRLYREGVGIVDLSKKFDFPPMNIFRVILKEMGWSKSRIKETLRTPSKFKERERKEFEAAEAADRVSNVDQSETHERADLFEEILADWFEEQGVRLRRQPEMVKEQMIEHGRPVNTPDLLFMDHVKINGKSVSWIDAKHFYGADVDFQRKKIMKQTARYVDSWGQGALVFRHGFCSNIHVPGTVLLDCGPLDLSPLEQFTVNE
ncbi:MAG: TPD domain-containing protein [Candidatus Poseidoniaceae archaeon]|nr:TPD domain-containing protein [Candidatus Poseidoniaceae archaeon]